jgi:mediator of RNA polymerase II transcription subunit 11
MASPLEKIQALDAIEKEIILCIQNAGNALIELSKEKPSQKNAEVRNFIILSPLDISIFSTFQNHTSQFLKSLNSIENKLSDQIAYLIQVSTISAHEGSGYGSAKVLQMAWHRMHNVRHRIKELEDAGNKHARKQTPQASVGNQLPSNVPQ